MTGVRTDAPRDLEELIKDSRRRLVALERRRTTGGSGGEPAYDSGWVELKTQVTFATGWTLAGSVASVKARRVGAMVQMVIQYASVAAGTFNVPTHGNITNSIVLTGIPEEFRPAPGTQGAAVTGNTGATASFQVSDIGELSLTALAPDATLTASTSNIAQSFTIVGTWMADGSKPLGPAGTAGAGSSDVVAGFVSPFAGANAPTGWLLCDGSAFSPTAYPDLFAAIGVMYGGTAAAPLLPNLNGRVPVGKDSTQTEFDVLGETGGTKTENLDRAGIGAKINVATAGTIDWLRQSTIPSWTGELRSTTGFTTVGGATVGGVGLAGTLNNLQPYITLNYIIATGTGDLATGGGVTNPLPPPAMSTNGGSASVTATTFTAIPTYTPITLVLSAPAWVEVSFQAWVGLTSTSGEVRVGVALSGAITQAPNVTQAGSSSWGAVAIRSGVQGPGAEQYMVSKTVLVPAGTTVFTPQAYIYGSPTGAAVNYGLLTVTPFAWDGAPGAIQTRPRLARLTMASNMTTSITAGQPASVVWAADDFNSGMWVGASDPAKIMPGVLGYYRISAKLRIMVPTGHYGFISLSKNGVQPGESAAEHLQTVNGGPGAYPTLTDIVKVTSPTDYWRIYAHASQPSIQITAVNCLCLVEYLGPL